MYYIDKVRMLKHEVSIHSITTSYILKNTVEMNSDWKLFLSVCVSLGVIIKLWIGIALGNKSLEEKKYIYTDFSESLTKIIYTSFARNELKTFWTLLMYTFLSNQWGLSQLPFNSYVAS